MIRLLAIMISLFVKLYQATHHSDHSKVNFRTTKLVPPKVKLLKIKGVTTLDCNIWFWNKLQIVPYNAYIKVIFWTSPRKIGPTSRITLNMTLAESSQSSRGNKTSDTTSTTNRTTGFLNNILLSIFFWKIFLEFLRIFFRWYDRHSRFVLRKDYQKMSASQLFLITTISGHK